MVNILCHNLIDDKEKLRMLLYDAGLDQNGT